MTSLSVRIMWPGDMFSAMWDKAKKSDIRCWARTNRHNINKNKEKYDHHYITEPRLLLKVAFSTIKPTNLKFGGWRFLMETFSSKHIKWSSTITDMFKVLNFIWFSDEFYSCWHLSISLLVKYKQIWAFVYFPLFTRNYQFHAFPVLCWDRRRRPIFNISLLQIMNVELLLYNSVYFLWSQYNIKNTIQICRTICYKYLLSLSISSHWDSLTIKALNHAC